MTREEAEQIVAQHAGHFDWSEAMVEVLLAAVAEERERIIALTRHIFGPGIGEYPLRLISAIEHGEKAPTRQPREITDAMVEAFLDSWYGSRTEWDKHYPTDHPAHEFAEEAVLNRRRGCHAALKAAERAEGGK